MTSDDKIGYNTFKFGGMYLDNISYDEILSAQNGNDQAMTEIMKAYKPLVASIAKRYYLNGGDSDDLLQEAMIGLYKSIKSYKRTKNDNFSAFAVICVNRHLQTVVRQSNRQKHLPLNSYISFDSGEDIEIFGAMPDPAENAIYFENLEQLTDKIQNKLSVFEKKVFTHYCYGISYKDMAIMLNVTEKSINNAMCRIKSKIKTDY